VVIPTVQAWVEHLIEQNLSRVLHNVRQGEQEVAGPTRMDTLDDVLSEADRRDAAAAQATPEATDLRQAVSSAQHRVAETASAVWGSIGTPGEMIKRILPAFSVPGEPAITSSRNVRIRDLSAHRIEEASESKELLILTHGGMLLGIVVPVSQRLVHFLIDQNLSRVMFNAQMAEKELSTGEPFTTLDQVVQQAEQPGPDPQPAPRSRAH
jgi:hypothetical protein